MKDIFTHGGNIHEIFRQNKIDTLLDFSANINPLGLSPLVRTAIEEGISGIVHYPDPDGYALKNSLSAAYDLPMDTIVLGNGAAELLYVFFHTVRPRRVLLPVPSFGEYERAARAAQAEIVYHKLTEEDGFALSPERLCQQFSSADCVVLGNPNNPTGKLISEKDWEQIFLQAEKAGCYLIVDESFMDFIDLPEKYSCRFFMKKYPNCMLLQSLTKIYAIPGLRLGFAALQPSLARKLELAKDPWNVNSLAQQAGVAALQDKEYQTKSLAFIQAEKTYLYHALQQMKGITVYEPSVNFILLSLEPSGIAAATLRTKMLQHGVMVRDCSNYPALHRHFIRIAVKLRNDNEFLLQAMQKVLKECQV